ncbi:PREDICTED: BRISC complex subunit FAM175B-like [Cyphomyrmex costatus]|nr:PREDICTED: BRISC complex subunit FAM175B-like [Cyphomyrmex costatus]
MADGDLLVTISGAALSLLFYENVRSVGEQMGFLLGEALEFIVKTYTDSDNQVETIKIHINVETIVTCPLSDLLYDSSGRINKEKLKDFMDDKSKQVIGWFRFRRNTSNLTPTMRDKILHKQFASHFSSGNNYREDFFLTCLLNASISETRGTHKFRHVFLRHKRGIFEPIPLRINNLGDDASRHDGSDYKPTPVRKSTRLPDGFTQLIESLKLDMTRKSGLDSAMTIQKAAERHLMSLIPKVCESDLEVAELERQVSELKMIAAQRLSRKVKVNGESYEKTFKANRENCFSEKIDFSTKDEMKISDDKRLQRENPSCAQPVTSNSWTQSRNTTAACIAKSVTNQEKVRRWGRGNPQEDNNQQQNTQNSPCTNSKRSIPEIVTESICQEDNEASMGRGRGRGRGNLDFMVGEMKKVRHNSNTSQVHSRERSITPEQDFSDAECSAAVSLSSSVLR